MGNPAAPKDREWERGWDGHQTAQVLRWASLSFRDKILWLEEAEAQLESMRSLHRR